MTSRLGTGRVTLAALTTVAVLAPTTTVTAATPSPTPAPEQPVTVTDEPTLSEPPGPVPDATISPVEDEEFPSPGPDVVTTARPGIPVGLVLGGLLVIAAGVAAAVRARRRTRGG